MINSGIDVFEKNLPKKFHGLKAGLLIHPASVNKKIINTKEILLQSKKIKIAAFFGPQHGIWGNTQDNMVEWEGFVDSSTGLPVYSLYGRTRKPLPEMLKILTSSSLIYRISEHVIIHLYGQWLFAWKHAKKTEFRSLFLTELIP